MKILIVSADRTTSSGHPQNIGDAFLTDALSAALRSSGHSVNIADFGAAPRLGSTEIRNQLGGIAGLGRLIRAADAVVLGGGTLLADDQPERPFAGLPRLCLAVAGLTRLSRRRFSIFGAGMDPIERRIARLAIALTLRAARVWVRDDESALRAEGLVRRKPGVSGDVSLFVSNSLTEIVPSERRGAVVALNRRDAEHLTVEHVEQLKSRFGTVTFVSMDQGDDADGESLSAEVRAALAYTARDLSWQSALQIISLFVALVNQWSKMGWRYRVWGKD